MLMVAAGAFALAACAGDGEVRIVGVDGRDVAVHTEATTTPGSAEAPSAASPTSEPAQPPGTPDPTPTPDSPSPGTSPGTSPPAPTVPTVPRTPGARGDDLAGLPYSTSDIRSAVLRTGQTFESAENAPDEICPDTSVPATLFSTATSVGMDDGLTWALWVYPTVEEREADWAFGDGRLEPTTDDCELPTGFNYFNANAVMAFVSWDGSEQRSPREDEAREAFLTMGSAAED